ncbi:MAG: hypothetical protein J6A83_03390 [Clostridia bacterium]|nr:hypothetical protein [Clostridia bacterium]
MIGEIALITVGFLVIDESARDALYLGYQMKLTPAEYRILRELVSASCAGIDELVERCGFAEKKRNNISVHICAINRKAERIGKRKLILFENQKYHINEFM